MTNEVPNSPLAAGLGSIRRRAVGGASEELVRSRPLFAAHDLPLLVEPAAAGVDLAGWAAASHAFLEEKLARHGGILFRGFPLREPAELEAVIGAACGQSLEYRERSSPRHAVAGRIYSSTDYPPRHPIFFHNENSYQQEWPLRIFFFARQPAAQGGATPIADCRRVLARIDPEIRERFARRGWMYVRNFGDGFGLAWQTVFQTADRGEVWHIAAPTASSSNGRRKAACACGPSARPSPAIRGRATWSGSTMRRSSTSRRSSPTSVQRWSRSSRRRTSPPTPTTATVDRSSPRCWSIYGRHIAPRR